MRLAIGRAAREFVVAFAVAAAVVLLGFARPAHAQTKVALVIGNGAYQNVPALPNPAHDAADVAAAFERLGFSVQLVKDANYDGIRRALLQFSGKAREAEMAVIFFAGHGMEIDGENWLIPVDAELKTDLDVSQEAISLHSIILMVTPATKLGLVILDACRSNPFTRKMKRTIATRALSRGLSRIEPANNVLVAYSAKDGTTANDGVGRNSPFTTALLKYLEAPGLEITFLFRDVRDDVINATNSEQQPFVYGSLSKEAIYFRPPPDALASPAPDAIAWFLIKETTDEAALKRFTTQYPNSALRKEAEARIAALEAVATAKPVPLRPDEVSWELLKETTDESALKWFIAQYPDSPLRKQAEARLDTLTALRAAQPMPPSPEQVAWNMVKDTTDPDQLRRFVHQFPDSPSRPEAERRAIELAAAVAAASTNAVDPHALALALQFELRRVGCFNGPLSGEYDDATRTASRTFAKLASVTVQDGLSMDAIKAVRGFSKRVCPLVCREDELPEGDRCIAIAPAHKPEAHKDEAKPKEPRNHAIASSRNATTESFSIQGSGTIKHGQSVELTTRDGRKMICVGGSIGSGTSRTCTWR
jgi:hypothetical protein